MQCRVERLEAELVLLDAHAEPAMDDETGVSEGNLASQIHPLILAIQENLDENIVHITKTQSQVMFQIIVKVFCKCKMLIGGALCLQKENKTN